MEVGTIRQINIDNEMQASYLDYAMSVIVSRALPDVRDGLKPVHRRILYAMHDLGLTNDKPYKKSARIVGEVLGKYHPHGDAAVYEAMVRMAQDFSLRYPLVDGQGNFGSIDGDNAAAMRYTEARLAAIANEMLADIDKDTVDWNDNFDGTLKEPSVLPAALPNLVVNGSAGIAVGMATNIPPHNLGEVCDALCYIIDNYSKAEDISTEDLMRFIQGPDFPTGGVVFRYQHEGSGDEAEKVDAIERAYGGGKGTIVVQAKAHIEEMSRNRNRIVVTELPYQTDKSRLLERIAELVREGRIEGITDLRDESDRTGMRICIEMTRTVDARKILADLYKYTPLQSTFGISLLALVDGEPRLLSLKRMLLYFLEYRQQVILRRSRFELAKAKARAHILEGLLRALDVLDEIITLIRGSRTADIARQGLKSQFGFSELQAQAILDMQLRRLAALERQRLQDEYKQVQKLIKELEELLASPKKVLLLIRQNLRDLRERYADARRTQIADRAKAVLTAREHAVERDVWVALTADGRLATYRRGVEEGGSAKLSTSGGELSSLLHSSTPPLLLYPANTRQDLYLFTASGRAARIEGHRWPDAGGAAIADLAGIKEGVAGMLAVECREGDEQAQGYLVLGTAQGKVKRASLSDLYAQAHTGPQVINIEDGDSLAWAATSAGEGEILLFTSQGQSIRFGEEDVRPMGLPAGGVAGIKLRNGDRVVAGLVIGRLEIGGLEVGKSGKGKGIEGERGPEGANLQSQISNFRPKTIAIVTTAGYARQVPLDEFPAQGRYGTGVVAARVSERLGQVAGAAPFGPGRTLVCVLAGGMARVLGPKEVPTTGRDGLGKQALKGERVERLYSVEGGEPEPARSSKSPNGTGGAGKAGGTRASAGRGASAATPKAPRDGNGKGKAAADGQGSAGSRAAAIRAARKGTAPADQGTGAGVKPAEETGAPASKVVETAAPVLPSTKAEPGRRRAKAEPEGPALPAPAPAVESPAKGTRKGSAKAPESGASQKAALGAGPAREPAKAEAKAPEARGGATRKGSKDEAAVSPTPTARPTAAQAPKQRAAAGKSAAPGTPSPTAEPRRRAAGTKAGPPPGAGQAEQGKAPQTKTGTKAASKAAGPGRPAAEPRAASRAGAPPAGSSRGPAALTFDREELLRAAGLKPEAGPSTGSTGSPAGPSTGSGAGPSTGSTGSPTDSTRSPAGSLVSRGAGAGKAGAAARSGQGQLPLDGLDEPARAGSATGKPKQPGVEAPKAAKGETGRASPGPAKSAGETRPGAGRKARAAPESPAASAPAPAGTPPAPASRPKRSAADGPMTWPVVPPTRDDDDGEEPVPSRSRRPRRS